MKSFWHFIYIFYVSIFFAFSQEKAKLVRRCTYIKMNRKKFILFRSQWKFNKVCLVCKFALQDIISMKRRSKIIRIKIRSSSSSSRTPTPRSLNKSTRRTASIKTNSITAIDIHEVKSCSSKSVAYDHHRIKKNHKKFINCFI